MALLVSEILGSIGSIVESLFLLTFIAVPIICAFRGYGFWRTNLIAIPLITLLITLWAWFIPFYDDFQLWVIGFDMMGMSDAERLRNVDVALHARAQVLYQANMGIGWPLKAIMSAIMLLPYPSVVWIGWKLAKSLLKRIWH